MSVNIPKRSEVAIKDTWDLDVIFKNNEEWEASYKKVEAEYPAIEKFKGHILDSADTLLELLKFSEAVSLQAMHLYVFTHLNSDTDVSNGTYLAMQTRAINLITNIEASFAFIDPEILEADEKVLDDYINSNDELTVYKHYFKRLLARRPYTLTDREESILAMTSGTLSLFDEIYGVYTNSEMKMPEVTDDKGNKLKLSYGRYNVLRESPNKEVRKEAFLGMHNTYGDNKNTLANVLGGQIKADNFKAAVRGFDSARHAALFANNVPESVYQQLLDTVNNNLDALHRYVEVRKNILGLDEINMYDLYTPLVADIDLKFTKNDAKEIILEALLPLGEE